jgi:hypothetical protein
MLYAAWYSYRAGALLGHPAGITVNDDELYVIITACLTASTASTDA